MTMSPRTAAALAVEMVFAGRALDDALAAVSDQVESKDRALLAELAYGVCRWSEQLNALLDCLLHKRLKLSKRITEQVMRVGLYQLLHTRIPPHAAIDESVKTTRELKQLWTSTFVNGVLRQAQREEDKLLARIQYRPEVRYGLPDWLVQRLAKHWSKEHLQQIGAALLERPPMTLRVNARQSTTAAYAERLSAAGMAHQTLAHHPQALVLESPVAVEHLPGFAEGACSVQDAGAQLAAAFLAPQSGEKILDACAAPGGKTTHLLELAPDIALTAVDSDAARLVRVRENLQRLGLQAELCVDDLSAPQREWAAASFDAILLDVPCSATGVIRRHPDIRLLRKAADITPLVQLQGRILHQCWQLLRPGGRLLYVTCSILAEENWLQIAAFCKTQADAKERPLTHPDLLPCPHGVQAVPGTASMDGFYFVLLEKSA